MTLKEQTKKFVVCRILSELLKNGFNVRQTQNKLGVSKANFYKILADAGITARHLKEYRADVSSRADIMKMALSSYIPEYAFKDIKHLENVAIALMCLNAPETALVNIKPQLIENRITRALDDQIVQDVINGVHTNPDLGELQWQ